MPTTTITDKLCERVRPPEFGRVEFFDARVPGFSLRVTDRGVRPFLFYTASMASSAA